VRRDSRQVIAPAACRAGSTGTPVCVYITSTGHRVPLTGMPSSARCKQLRMASTCQGGHTRDRQASLYRGTTGPLPRLPARPALLAHSHNRHLHLPTQGPFALCRNPRRAQVWSSMACGLWHSLRPRGVLLVAGEGVAVVIMPPQNSATPSMGTAPRGAARQHQGGPGQEYGVRAGNRGSSSCMRAPPHAAEFPFYTLSRFRRT
jgi:hypothetical protein